MSNKVYTVPVISPSNNQFNNKDIETMLLNEQLSTYISISISNNNGVVTDDTTVEQNGTIRYKKYFSIPVNGYYNFLFFYPKVSNLTKKTYYYIK